MNEMLKRCKQYLSQDVIDDIEHLVDNFDEPEEQLIVSAILLKLLQRNQTSTAFEVAGQLDE